LLNKKNVGANHESPLRRRSQSRRALGSFHFESVNLADVQPSPSGDVSPAAGGQERFSFPTPYHPQPIKPIFCPIDFDFDFRYLSLIETEIEG
jgi:hypothetical protein